MELGFIVDTYELTGSAWIPRGPCYIFKTYEEADAHRQHMIDTHPFPTMGNIKFEIKKIYNGDNIYLKRSHE
jgi:hypothetical protein